MPIALPFDDDEDLAPAAAPTPFLFDSDILPSGRGARAKPWTSGALHAFELAQQRRSTTASMGATDGLVLASMASLDGKAPTAADVQDLHDADSAALLLRARWLTFAQAKDRGRVIVTWFCAPPFIDRALACDGLQEAPNRMQVPFDASGGIATTPAVLPERVALPASKRLLTYAAPTRRATYAYLEAKQADAQQGKPGGEVIDLWRLALARNVHLDGERATEEMLATLPPEDMAEVTARLAQRGGPETLVKASCPRCGALLQMPLEALPGFYAPTMPKRGRAAK